jgi:hypothetical protein
MDRRTVAFVGVGLVAALLIAGGLSLIASDEPDGLERVSIDEGFADQAQEHDLAESPLADYQVTGRGRWGTALAGVIGVVVTLGITVGLLWLVRRPDKAGS